MCHAQSLGQLAGARQGSMAIELALVAPVLLLLTAAVVDFGSAVNRQLQLIGAVRAGTQLAVARPPTAETLHEIRAAVQLTAPRQAGDTQELAVELFCEQVDGERVGCNPTAGQEHATYVSIRLSEIWSPTLTYPLLRQALPLGASQTVRVR